VARPVARQMSFADLELLRQGVRLEPLLQAICDFLDKQPALVERVRRDLVCGLKQPDHGRRGLTAPQVLRALVLMRLKNWDYRELRERIADGITLRAFTNFYCEEVPKHDAFNRSFNRLTPATLKAINELVVEAAVKLGLEDGRKLRVDTTVVETDIHHPTDNTLLWDVVRVLTRLLGRLAEALELPRISGFRNRSRAAHRRMYEIQRMTTRQRQGAGSQQTAAYRALIAIAEEVVASARTALDDTAAMRGKDPLTALNIKALREEIAHYCDLGTRVIGQARRRVLDGEQVPTSEKIYSIFEPHTDLIKRGKVRTPVEFGHKVFLAESARGLITQYEALKGNPRSPCGVLAAASPPYFPPRPAALRRRSRLLQREQSRRLRERRRRDGVHSAAWRPQDAATPSLRTIARIQARPALPCRHRGAHIRVDARPRHEALPHRRRRALRAVCRRRGARQ
jgi:IS5 family transposase